MNSTMTRLGEHPVPYILKFYPAGAELKPGMLAELRKGLLHPHGTPGGSHSNLFVCSNEMAGGDRESYAIGEQVPTIQPFARTKLKVLVRKGEKLVAGKYAHGTTFCGTHLASAGDGTLISESRFASVAAVAAKAISDLDLSAAEQDQLVEIESVY